MITIIKLAPGSIGWFDPLTGIHLTLAKTESIVRPGMNTTNIKSALAERKIILKQGTLETSRIISEPVSTDKTIGEQTKAKAVEIKTEKENIVTTASNKDVTKVKKAKPKTKKKNK